MEKRTAIAVVALLGVLLALCFISLQTPQLDPRGDVNLDLPQRQGPWGTSRSQYWEPEPLLTISPLYSTEMARMGRTVPVYGYALNNPIGATDPTGLQSSIQWCNESPENMKVCMGGGDVPPTPPEPVPPPEPEPPGPWQRFKNWCKKKLNPPESPCPAQLASCSACCQTKMMGPTMLVACLTECTAAYAVCEKEGPEAAGPGARCWPGSPQNR